MDIDTGVRQKFKKRRIIASGKSITTSTIVYFCLSIYYKCCLSYFAIIAVSVHLSSGRGQLRFVKMRSIGLSKRLRC